MRRIGSLDRTAPGSWPSLPKQRRLRVSNRPKPLCAITSSPSSGTSTRLISASQHVESGRREDIQEFAGVDDPSRHHAYLINSQPLSVLVDHHHPPAVAAEISRRRWDRGEIGGVDPVAGEEFAAKAEAP
jgi:hypothetical protein